MSYLAIGPKAMWQNEHGLKFSKITIKINLPFDKLIILICVSVIRS
jgi:hypothetical protein